MTALLWLRRDLRRGDHPALLAAADDGPVLPLFVIEPRLWNGAGAARRAWLAASLAALREDLGGRLTLRIGDPAEAVASVAEEAGAHVVHASAETTPGGIRRDARVRERLAGRGVGWKATGTPYAIEPGAVVKDDGGGYSVFTPFLKAWMRCGYPAPASDSDSTELVEGRSDRRAVQTIRDALDHPGVTALWQAGERAALERWAAFREEELAGYGSARNRADLDATSRLSPYLKVGAIHPRTLLFDLRGLSGAGVERFVAELAWREFYADILFRHPATGWSDFATGLGSLEYDDRADPRVSTSVEAWRSGRTGFPFIDAGMRQLLATGWMHNRARMATASFFTKDLHLWWPAGARHFLDHLIDADLASNSHGWQWVAGTGTDAAPYVRVFNPVVQGQRFDPDGDYVRRWIPELRHLAGAAVHEPWKASDGYDAGYPERILDHAEERREALRRFDVARSHPR